MRHHPPRPHRLFPFALLFAAVACVFSAGPPSSPAGAQTPADLHGKLRHSTAFAERAVKKSEVASVAEMGSPRLQSVSRPTRRASQGRRVLQNQPTTGRINISTNPGGSPLFIDGSDAGLTTENVRSINLLPGPHTVAIQFPNATRWSHDIDIVAGRTVCIALTYRPRTITIPPDAQTGGEVGTVDPGEVSSVIADGPPTLTLDLDTQVVTLCPGAEATAEARVRLKAKASSPGGHPLRYRWAVSGGSVMGDGTDVVWDLSGAQHGVYQTTVTAESEPAGGPSAMAFVSKSVVVRQCPKPSAQTGGEAETSERPVASSRQQGVEKIEVGELSGTIADCGELEVLVGSAQPEMPTATSSEIRAPRTRNGHGPARAPAQTPELRMPPPPPPVTSQPPATSTSVTEVREEYAVVRVFYGTDRKQTGSHRADKFYGGERSPRDTYEAGVCDVTIPKTHKIGQLEAPSILRLEFSADPARHVILRSVTPLGREEFFSGLRERFAQTGGAHALVFIHGFNVTFEDAARRTAQIAYDLGFNGVPLMYSWPSRGSLLGYRRDEESVKLAVPHLKQFLEDVAAELGPGARIHLIAHSMGNRALTNALRGIADDGRPSPLFNQVILTAPDIDADVFLNEIAPAIQKTAAQVTLYASSDDKALAAGRRIHGKPRAGESGDYILTIPGIVTVDASGIDTSLLGHSYYAELKSVLDDMDAIMRHGHGPAERKLRALTRGSATYWSLLAAAATTAAVAAEVPVASPPPGTGGGAWVVPSPALLLLAALVLAAIVFLFWGLIRRRRGAG